MWRKRRNRLPELELKVALDLGRLEGRAEKPDQVRPDLDGDAEQLVDQIGNAAVHAENRAKIEAELD